MRPKSLILLVMALGCGLVAAVGINQIMARPSNDAETTSIVVAKKEILKGDLIKPDDIRLQEWRSDALPEGAIEKIEDLQDKRVKNTIIAGEPILAGKLLEGNGFGVEIPAGMKAVTVKVTSDTGGGGLIFPGDNVDVHVFAEKNEQRGIMETTTNRMLSNVKVLAVDDTTHRPDGGEQSIAAKTVALLVSDKDAMRVTMAQEIGKIVLVMRSTKKGSEDEESTNSAKMTIPEVLHGMAESTPAPSAPSATITHLPPVGPSLSDKFSGGAQDFMKILDGLKDPGATEKKPFKVVLISGLEATEMEFTEGNRLPQTVGASGGAGYGDTPPTSAFDTKLGLPSQNSEPEDEEEPTTKAIH